MHVVDLLGPGYPRKGFFKVRVPTVRVSRLGCLWSGFPQVESMGISSVAHRKGRVCDALLSGLGISDVGIPRARVLRG